MLVLFILFYYIYVRSTSIAHYFPASLAAIGIISYFWPGPAVTASRAAKKFEAAAAQRDQQTDFIRGARARRIRVRKRHFRCGNGALIAKD